MPKSHICCAISFLKTFHPIDGEAMEARENFFLQAWTAQAQINFYKNIFSIHLFINPLSAVRGTNHFVFDDCKAGDRSIISFITPTFPA